MQVTLLPTDRSTVPLSRHLGRLASETAIYGIGGVLTNAISVFLLPIYAHAFSPADYGVIGIVSTTTALLSIFVVLALDNSAARWYWDTEDEADRKSSISSWFWCQLLMATILAATLALFAPQLSKAVLGRSSATLYFRLAAATIPLGTFNTVVINLFRLRRRPVATVIFTAGSAVFTTTLTIVLILPVHLGLKGFYLAQLGGALLWAGVAGVLLSAWIRPRSVSGDRLWEMLRYSGPLIPGAIAFWVVAVSDRYLVELFRNLADVGLYQMSNNLASGVAIITIAFQYAWGPFAISIHREEGARDVYASALIAYIWLCCFAATALAVLTPDILYLLGASRYEAASSSVFVLALGNVMVGLGYIAALGPNIAKRNGPVGIAIVLAAVLNIALNLVLIPAIGRDGAALSTLLSQALVPIYLFYRSQSLYYIPYRFGVAAGLVSLSVAVDEFVTHLHLTPSVTGAAIKVLILLLFVPAAFVARLIRFDQIRLPRLRHDKNMSTVGINHSGSPADAEK